jgi:5-methylcytosine-specific restriction endonuclease McrBC regulatory subunit McrC
MSTPEYKKQWALDNKEHLKKYRAKYYSNLQPLWARQNLEKGAKCLKD